VVLLDARPCRDATASKAICQQRDVLHVWEAVGPGRRIADEGLTSTPSARLLQRMRTSPPPPGARGATM
jgi:3-(3-hydroxy-phenyl)propionate hydroxylase